MLLIGDRNRLLDYLGLEQIMLAERNLVVLAGEQHEDVDVVVTGLRPVDQPACAGPLPERVVDVFRIVGEHAERAIAAHHGGGAGEALHQYAGDLLLACRSAVVGALGRDLVDVVDGAEADGARVENVVDELLAVLARLALVGRNLVDAEILVVEREAGDLAVIVEHAGRHLDQDRLAGARRAVADEGEQEAAELDEGVELAVEIIRHQHLGELHRLVFGDVVADDLVRFLERHDQRLGFLAGRDVEAVDREIVLFDADMHVLEGAQAAVEAALALQQPLDRLRREGACARRQILLVLGAGYRCVEPGDHVLQRILRRVEHEMRLGDVVGRLRAAFDELKQVGGEGEG